MFSLMFFFSLILNFIIFNIQVCSGEESSTNVDHTCDKINHVTDSYGQIISPSRRVSGNVTYPENIECTWYIKFQPGKIITLSFLSFDVEEARLNCVVKPCCGETWLSISSIPLPKRLSPTFDFYGARETVDLRYCGKNLTLPPLVFLGSGLVMTFKTGETILGGRGFAIDYIVDKATRDQCSNDEFFHCRNGKCILSSWQCNGWDECGDSSDEQNCVNQWESKMLLDLSPLQNLYAGLCKPGFAHCASNKSICYNFAKQRCNGINDCPGGEDEHACALNCGNSLPCRSQGGCYNLAQRCDGVRDCFDNSDEDVCDRSVCGPQTDSFLCRNRRCISAAMRCDGIHDCGDFSDEESCMKMSVITAVILGSLICGLLLIIAAGCGLRLYHLRVALEQRWSTIRLQQRTLSQDFDEFGQRRPIMGRLPPPTYAQATGTFVLPPPPPPPPPPHSLAGHSSRSHRHRRGSGRVRRPAPPLPSAPVVGPLPLQGNLLTEARSPENRRWNWMFHWWRRSSSTTEAPCAVNLPPATVDTEPLIDNLPS